MTEWTLRILSFVLGSFLCIAPLEAHELNSTTGTITLREGHLRLDLHVDVLRWLQALDDGRQSIPIERLSLVDPSALDALVLEAKHALSKQLRLEVNGEHIAVARIQFPAPTLIHEAGKSLTMARSLDTHAHAPKMPIVIEATLLQAPEQVSVQLPPSLGKAFVQLIRPQSKVLAAGQTGSYSLTTSADLPPTPPTATPLPRHLAFATLFGMLLLILGQTLWRRYRIQTGKLLTPAHPPCK